MDVPYLMHVPDCDELWLVDGEQRLLITPRIYDLLASNGADLPPAYGIEELREQNDKLRELVRDLYLCSDETCTDCEYHDYSGKGFWCKRGVGWKKARMRELGVEVDE